LSCITFNALNRQLSKIVEVLKLPLKYCWVILIVSCLLLFLPADPLQSPGMAKISWKYQGWIGGLFIFSASMLFVSLAETVLKRGKKKCFEAKLIQGAITEIKNIDPKERAVLREFTLQEQDSIQSPIDQAIVAGLLRKGILVQTGPCGERSLAGLLLPLTIRKEIKKILTVDDIDLPMNPNDRDVERIRDERPDFIHKIEQHRLSSIRLGRGGRREGSNYKTGVRSPSFAWAGRCRMIFQEILSFVD
jgi:Super-infection exclusion protein B